MVKEESRRYMESILQQQEWNGSEPALQLLLLPLIPPPLQEGYYRCLRWQTMTIHHSLLARMHDLLRRSPGVS